MEKRMEGNARRAELLEILKHSSKPVSGTALAKSLGVSRQVIVQDIALIRAVDQSVVSTPKGYTILDSAGETHMRRFSVSHSREDLEQELNCIVDLGARVLDVVVEHPVYGEIRGNLQLRSRRDITAFIKRLASQKGIPLLEISGGLHQHTVAAESEEILDEVELALREHGFLAD